MQVDGAGMDGGEGPLGLDRAQELARACLDDRHRVRRCRAQRDVAGREARAARQVAALATAPQLAEPDQGVGALPPPLAEYLRVRIRERRLVGRGEQVRELDPLVLVIEDRRLHRAAPGTPRDGGRRTGPARPRRRRRARALAAPARPPPHLPQARDRAGEGDADRRVQLPDVDAQLERVGGDHREQLAGRQPSLDLAALLGRVAGPVGGDPLGELRAAQLLEPGARKALDQLDSAPAAQEADRPHPLADQVGEQLGGLGEDRAPRHRPRVDDRRIPDPDPAAGARSAVGIDQAEGLADQPLGELHRIGDRGRGAG